MEQPPSDSKTKCEEPSEPLCILSSLAHVFGEPPIYRGVPLVAQYANSPANRSSKLGYSSSVSSELSMNNTKGIPYAVFWDWDYAPIPEGKNPTAYVEKIRKYMKTGNNYEEDFIIVSVDECISESVQNKFEDLKVTVMKESSSITNAVQYRVYQIIMKFVDKCFQPGKIMILNGSRDMYWLINDLNYCKGFKVTTIYNSDPEKRLECLSTYAFEFGEFFEMDLNTTKCEESSETPCILPKLHMEDTSKESVIYEISKTPFAIYWDLEYAPLPKDKSPTKFVEKIRQYMGTGNSFEDDFVVVCVEECMNINLLREFEELRVTVYLVPSSISNAVRNRLYQGITRFVNYCSTPAKIMILNGGIAMHWLINELTFKGYEVTTIYNFDPEKSLEHLSTHAFEFGKFFKMELNT